MSNLPVSSKPRRPTSLPASVAPRALVHRGVVAARGFWFPRATVSEVAARRRILALWQSGALVERFESGLLLKLPTPIMVRTDAAPGTPLEERETGHGLAFAAAPFSPDEWRQIAAAPGSVVIVTHGQTISLIGGESEDPARWLDCGDFSVAVTHSLGAMPEIALALQTFEFEAREKLSGLLPADSQLAEVMESIRRRREQAIEGSTQPASGVWRFLPQGIFTLGEARFSGWRPLFGVPVDDPALEHALQPLISLAWLAPLWRDTQNGRALPAQNGADAAGKKWGALKELESRSSSAATPGEALRRMLARTALLLQLGGMIGRRQAQYIARMMQMFEDGNWQDALRHAIPLGGEADQNAPQALSAPRARHDLEISPGLSRARSTFNFGADLNAHLGTLYRRAFEQLKELNRIDEAAFVLAELLGASEEAVAFLEANGKLRLAAEMAEARQLPPGLVVRQWFIAGDRNRAVLYARQSGAFSDAVARLERGSHAAEAAALRLLWGDSLAKAGAFLGAVEAVWPVEVARPLAREWIERGVALGGVAGARLLARYIALDPEARSQWQGRAEDLLEDEDAENAPARHAFARTLAPGDSAPQRASARMMARVAVRSLNRDAVSGVLQAGTNDYRRLLDIANDAALRADAAALPAAPPQSQQAAAAQKQKKLLVFEASDTTGLAIWDAALLPDGSLVAALGESGTRLLARDGHTRAVLNEPAYRLVLADSGSRALALAPRGEATRIAHLDFASRIASHWDDAALPLGAETYDGSHWIATDGAELLALDTQAARPVALWKSGATSGHIISLSRAPDLVSALVYSSGVTDAWGNPSDPWEKWEIWRFAGAPLVLRERAAAPPPIAGGFEPKYSLTADAKLLVAARQASPISADALAELSTSHADDLKPILFSYNHRVVHLGDESIGHNPLPPVAQGPWIAVGTHSENGMGCFLLDEETLQVGAVFDLRGASRISIRISEGDLIVCDDVGRLLVFDCSRRIMRRDLRLT